MVRVICGNTRASIEKAVALGANGGPRGGRSVVVRLRSWLSLFVGRRYGKVSVCVGPCWKVDSHVFIWLRSNWIGQWMAAHACLAAMTGLMSVVAGRIGLALARSLILSSSIAAFA